MLNVSSRISENEHPVEPKTKEVAEMRPERFPVSKEISLPVNVTLDKLSLPAMV